MTPIENAMYRIAVFVVLLRQLDEINAQIDELLEDAAYLVQKHDMVMEALEILACGGKQ
jgi:hypothetical protein